jgi:hypothetical protein
MRTWRTPLRVLSLLMAVPPAACAPEPPAYPTEMEMTTWSVVGVDAKTELIKQGLTAEEVIAQVTDDRRPYRGVHR